MADGIVSTKARLDSWELRMQTSPGLTSFGEPHGVLLSLELYSQPGGFNLALSRNAHQLRAAAAAFTFMADTVEEMDGRQGDVSGFKLPAAH